MKQYLYVILLIYIHLTMLSFARPLSNSRATTGVGQQVTPTVKAIIFGGSGILFDPGCKAPVKAIQKTFESIDLPVTEGEVRRSMGLDKKDHIWHLLIQISDRWYDRMGCAPTMEDATDIFNLYVPNQLEALEEYGQVVPGALECCQNLRNQGYMLGMTTSYNREMVDYIMDLNPKLDFWIECAVGSDEVPCGRPAPFMIQYVMDVLEVENRKHVVKIDDDIFGMIEGVTAGVWRVGTSKWSNMMSLDMNEMSSFQDKSMEEYLQKSDEIHTHLKKTGAHYVIEDLSGLDGVLAALNDRITEGQNPSV